MLRATPPGDPHAVPRASAADSSPEPAVLEDWAARARQGDPRAFEQLYLRLEPQLYHLAYHYLGDTDDALDACQEAALDAWRTVRRFQGGSDDLRRWLIRIVVNACLDRVRHEARRPQTPLEVQRHGRPVGLPLADPGLTPEQHAENGDLRHLLEACLAQLSVEHRTVILLDQLGLSYSEIAETAQLEAGTVKSRLSRARARMRQLLTTDEAWGREPAAPAERSDARVPGSGPRVAAGRGNRAPTGREAGAP